MQAPDIRAFELAAALDAYEVQLAAVRASPTPAALAQLQRHVHHVCRSCAGLPRLAAATVALLLSHHGFVADLVRNGIGATAGATHHSLQAVEQCVLSLQRQCRELFLAPHLH